MVRLLQEHKVDVNAKANDGDTALHIATWEGHEEVVRLLLEHKVDVNTNDGNGRTALCLAADQGHKAVVRLLLDAQGRPQS